MRVRGHVLIVVLARVSSKLVCDGVASPVVIGDLTVVLILLRLMSWDPFYFHGFSTPRNDSFLPKLPQIPVWLVNPSRWLAAPVLDSSEAFDNRLNVNSNRDGSRSVRSDDGGGKAHARGVVDGGTHSLLPVRHTASSISMLCSGYVVVSLSMWAMPIPALAVHGIFGRKTVNVLTCCGGPLSLYFGEKLNVKNPVWSMTFREHLSGSSTLNLHFAMYLLPLVVLPFPLQLVLFSHSVARPKSARDVACKLHGEAAAGEARGRFSISKFLDQACVLLKRGFQYCTLPESVIGVVSIVDTSVTSTVHCEPHFVKVSHKLADMMALSVVWSSLWVCCSGLLWVVYCVLLCLVVVLLLWCCVLCVVCCVLCVVVVVVVVVVRTLSLAHGSCVVVWLCGCCVVVWLCGCVVVWLCGCVVVVGCCVLCIVCCCVLLVVLLLCCCCVVVVCGVCVLCVCV